MKEDEKIDLETIRRRREMKAIPAEQRMQKFYNMMTQIWNNMSEDAKMKFHIRNLRRRSVK